MLRTSSVKKYGIAVAALTLAGSLAACGSGSSKSSTSSSTAAASSSIKVALILDGANNDGDYNEQGYRNFQSAVTSFGSKVTSTVEQNVPEGPQSAQVVNNLIGAGYRLFFVNGTGYETYLQPIAQAHPDIRIEEFESAVTAPNYGAYNINLAESAYLGGMALAAASKAGHLGIVAPFPFPGILTQVNGLELGAKAVNPSATLHVLFVSSFYDPAKEGQAAQALISDGTDAIADIMNDATVCQTAQTHSTPCVSQTLLNGPSYGPTTYLADFHFVWTPIYKEVISDVLAGKAVPTSIFGTYADGATGFGSFGPAYDKYVPAADQAKIAARETALKAGTFDPYAGPVMDQQGQLMVPAGKTLSTSQILSINWAVQGVIGSVKS